LGVIAVTAAVRIVDHLLALFAQERLETRSQSRASVRETAALYRSIELS